MVKVKDQGHVRYSPARGPRTISDHLESLQSTIRPLQRSVERGRRSGPDYVIMAVVMAESGNSQTPYSTREAP